MTYKNRYDGSGVVDDGAVGGGDGTLDLAIPKRCDNMFVFDGDDGDVDEDATLSMCMPNLYDKFCVVVEDYDGDGVGDESATVDLVIQTRFGNMVDVDGGGDDDDASVDVVIPARYFNKYIYIYMCVVDDCDGVDGDYVALDLCIQSGMTISLLLMVMLPMRMVVVVMMAH